MRDLTQSGDGAACGNRRGEMRHAPVALCTLSNDVATLRVEVTGGEGNVASILPLLHHPQAVTQLHRWLLQVLLAHGVSPIDPDTSAECC